MDSIACRPRRKKRGLRRTPKFVPPVRNATDSNGLPQSPGPLENLRLGPAGLNKPGLSVYLLNIEKSAYFFKRFDDFRTQEKEKMNTEADAASEIKRLALSLDSIFQRAEELNASFERSQKPRQKKIVEILHKHGIPACVGPFFDAYARISAAGGDIEQFSDMMVERLSLYLQEAAPSVAIRFREAIADYVEFISMRPSEGN